MNNKLNYVSVKEVNASIRARAPCRIKDVRTDSCDKFRGAEKFKHLHKNNNWYIITLHKRDRAIIRRINENPAYTVDIGRMFHLASSSGTMVDCLAMRICC